MDRSRDNAGGASVDKWAKLYGELMENSFLPGAKGLFSGFLWITLWTVWTEHLFEQFCMFNCICIAPS